MFRGRKSEIEVRYELFTWGAMLLVAALMYVIFKNSEALGLGTMLFFPGLILLGSSIYQDMQPDWKAGWLSYALAIILVATGLAGIVNRIFSLTGQASTLSWIVIAAVELGAVLIAKALYDPNPRP